MIYVYVPAAVRRDVNPALAGSLRIIGTAVGIMRKNYDTEPWSQDYYAGVESAPVGAGPHGVMIGAAGMGKSYLGEFFAGGALGSSPAILNVHRRFTEDEWVEWVSGVEGRSRDEVLAALRVVTWSGLDAAERRDLVSAVVRTNAIVHTVGPGREWWDIEAPEIDDNEALLLGDYFASAIAQEDAEYEVARHADRKAAAAAGLAARGRSLAEIAELASLSRARAQQLVGRGRRGGGQPFVRDEHRHPIRH